MISYTKGGKQDLNERFHANETIDCLNELL